MQSATATRTLRSERARERGHKPGDFNDHLSKGLRRIPTLNVELRDYHRPTMTCEARLESTSSCSLVLARMHSCAADRASGGVMPRESVASDDGPSAVYGERKACAAPASDARTPWCLRSREQRSTQSHHEGLACTRMCMQTHAKGFPLDSCALSALQREGGAHALRAAAAPSTCHADHASVVCLALSLLVLCQHPRPRLE